MNTKFHQKVEQAFNEWTKTGKCSEAENLNKAVQDEYFDTSNPHFFTGNLDAEVVLVQLNPKRDKYDRYGNRLWGKKIEEMKSFYSNFEEYWDFYSHFGKNIYGKDSKREDKSKFDHKQVRFLTPFNILPFKEDDIYHNLETVIDQKLQLELVPYGSPNFDYKKIGAENLKPFINTLLDVISQKERKYVIFCGRVFEEILFNHITKANTISKKLKKVDGTETQNEYQVINFKLKYNDKEVIACIAPQFAQQGCPISRYGEMIKENYGKF